MQLSHLVSNPQVCHNNTVDISIDSPEEVCDLQPQKMCKQVGRKGRREGNTEGDIKEL